MQSKAKPLLQRRHAVAYAFSWHGGQSSPLYSFASTGGVVHNEQHMLGLLGELEKNLCWCQHWINGRLAQKESPAEYQKEPHRLMRLRAFIKAQPLKETSK